MNSFITEVSVRRTALGQRRARPVAEVAQELGPDVDGRQLWRTVGSPISPRSRATTTRSSRSTMSELPPIMARSLASVWTAAGHPWPTADSPPSTFDTGTATSVRKTSLKWASPVICCNGRMSMPGVACRAGMVMPGASAGVGAASRIEVGRLGVRRPHLLAVHHELVAVPSGPVCSPARSLPASGSLNSWHHVSSPRNMAGRNRCRCSSVPSSRIAGRPWCGPP